MRILLTNDDGLRAPGIAAMYEALVDYHGSFGSSLGGAGTQVVPIAPLTVQSATSHGVTFHEPLMVREEFMSGSGPDDRMLGIAVDGRPADCVKLAITSLWPERFGAGSRPDLVVSGMNAGANAGINVIYSGTVAAALEAAFLGIPAIAVSLHLGKSKPRFDVAARHARHAIQAVLDGLGGLPAPHSCISINVPITDQEGPTPPMRVCPMNTHGLVDSYERRVSPGGDVYYWASGHGLDFRTTDPGSDVQELLSRHITVTPLSYDLTNHRELGVLRERLAVMTR
ncbi:MAG: 5'/3'-nucleotidase SurE [Pyrinomonadaceae bacterium]|nr:5'/3'-nucleotidase SurE [Phycisphaerales bacterium]